MIDSVHSTDRRRQGAPPHPGKFASARDRDPGHPGTRARGAGLRVTAESLANVTESII